MRHSQALKPPHHDRGYRGAIRAEEYIYQPPLTAQTSNCSIGLYASGLVVHDGKSIATIAPDGPSNALWTKGSVLTMVFDSDVERGTLTVSVDDKPLEAARFTGLFDKLGAECLYPCISLCPCLDDEDDEHDNEKRDERAGQAQRKEKTAKSSPSAAATAELPAGWKSDVSKSTGKTYYVNTYTKESTYDVPTQPALSEAQATIDTPTVRIVADSTYQFLKKNDMLGTAAAPRPDTGESRPN
eukprot:COSAG06_NODE_18103_length_904_cov_0.762733_1_plen_241_part_10